MSWSLLADGEDGDRLYVGRDTKQSAQALPAFTRHAVDATGKPLVERGEPDQHHRSARVDPPVGHGPCELLLLPVRLVGLAITRAIVLLANTNDNVCGGTGDPRLEACGDVLWLERQLGHRSPRLLVRDDDEAQTLAVAGAGDLPATGDDPLEHLAGHGIRQVAADGLAAAQHVGEVHDETHDHMPDADRRWAGSCRRGP